MYGITIQLSGLDIQSDDWRFGIAYNTGLKLCLILLLAEGFRPEKTLQHYRSIQALPLILGKEKKPTRSTSMPAALNEISLNMTMWAQ